VRLNAKQAIPQSGLPSDPRLTREVDISVQTLVPASTLDATVFSPGEPLSVDQHPISVRGMVDPLVEPPAPLITVDHVQLADNPRPPYGYAVKASVAVADVTSLRGASTDYPSWLDPYRSLYWGRTVSGYSNRDARILQKAEQIVQSAGASNPYDQAKAIESWFLAKGNFTYTLKPPPAPQGVRPLDYFLFQSHRGYCQDFATAMAVMLRELGIPSRLMSGFGLGAYDDRTHRYLVSTTDAHTWVEVYFPGYGWIPFEPTPDNLNFPVVRPLNASSSVPAGSSSGAAVSRPPNARLNELSQDGGSAPGPSLVTVEKQLALVVAGILLLLLVAGLLLLRWVMAPADIPRIWRRLLFLGDRLAVPRNPGDTPSEFGERLSTAIPELAPELRTLASLYTRARFRRGGLSGLERVEVRRSWQRVRRRYAGLLLERLRPGSGPDRFNSAEARVAGSHGPGSRRRPVRRGRDGSAGSAPPGARS
jgi:transglutaminase-like putative cysteine protease